MGDGGRLALLATLGVNSAFERVVDAGAAADASAVELRARRYVAVPPPDGGDARAAMPLARASDATNMLPTRAVDDAGGTDGGDAADDVGELDSACGEGLDALALDWPTLARIAFTRAPGAGTRARSVYTHPAQRCRHPEGGTEQPTRRG